MTKHYESPVVEIEKYTLCGDICTTSDGQGNGDDNIDLQGNITIGTADFNKKHPFSKIGMTEFL